MKVNKWHRKSGIPTIDGIKATLEEKELEYFVSSEDAGAEFTHKTTKSDELLWVGRGSLTITIGTTELILEAGDRIVLPADKSYSCRVGPDEPLEYIRAPWTAPIPFIEIMPKTIDEAVDWIIDRMDKDNRAKFLEIAETRVGVLIFHHGFGTYVRNSLGLWQRNNELIEACGSFDPDGASGKILEAVWDKLTELEKNGE